MNKIQIRRRLVTLRMQILLYDICKTNKNSDFICSVKIVNRNCIYLSSKDKQIKITFKHYYIKYLNNINVSFTFRIRNAQERPFESVTITSLGLTFMVLASNQHACLQLFGVDDRKSKDRVLPVRPSLIYTLLVHMYIVIVCNSSLGSCFQVSTTKTPGLLYATHLATTLIILSKHTNIFFHISINNYLS